LIRLVPLAFILLALAAYAPALGGWFLSDDAMIGGIYDGNDVNWSHVGRTFAMDWRGFNGAETRFFRPLVVITLALDAALWGLQPWGFHLTNVLLHGLVASLVVAVGTRLGASRSAALLGGALFALEPLHPESVAWISGRTDLVYALPALASIAAFLEHRRTGARSVLALAVALYVLALLAKENAVAIPLIVLVLDLSLPRRPPHRAPNASTTFALGLYGAASLLYVAWRTRIFGGVFAGHQAKFYHAPEGNFTRVTSDFVSNLELFLFPFNRQIDDQLALHIGASLAILALAFAGLWSALRRSVPWRSVLAALLALCASVAPIATMMQIQLNLTNSRMWYLPLAFLCLVVGMLCLSAVRPLGVAVAAGLLGAWFVLLRANLVPWVDAGQFMRKTRIVYANTFGAYPAERIEGLPPIDRGAYLALYNAECFGFPLVRLPPRLDQQLRYRMVYDETRRDVRVEPDPAWGAAERLDRDLASAVWLWHPDGAPLETAWLERLTPRTLAPGRYAFAADSADPWLIIGADRDIAPPERAAQPEYVYLLLRPAPAQAPQLFWIDAVGQNFGGDRVLSLAPELMLADGRIVPRQREGFFVYSARADGHPRWPGLHAVRLVRLDPSDAPGELEIRYFNIARQNAGAH
jgi:hypothetical protein